MDENDPRRELDQFTAFLVEQLREEIEITMKTLVSANAEVALAQIDVLRKRAIERLKKTNFEMWADVAAISPSDLPEQDVLKAIGIAIAAVEQSCDLTRDHVVACEKAIYGDGDDDDLGAAD